MAEYTDEQIKKALKRCTLKRRWCSECDYFHCVNVDCISQLKSDALDLINRQEAEIERLKEKNRLACQCTPKAIRRAKSEAIKEFAERIDKILCLQISPSKRLFWKIKEDIDNLVKEMVGENK